MINRLRVAIADGNWSNPATWNDNSVPEARDIVALNGKQITLDQNVSIFGFFNNIQTAINSFKYLTFNNLPEGIAESSDNSALAWYHFSNTDQYRSVPGISPSTPYWASYEYPNQTSFVLKVYQFNGYGNNHPFNPKSWEFQAWNGSSWVVLDSVVDYTNNYFTYIKELTTNSTAYYKYRFFVTAVHGGVGYNTINIARVRFWEDKAYRANSIDGGALTINSSRTLTVTDLPIKGGNYDFILSTAPAGSVVNINGRISPMEGFDKFVLKITGGATHNITGEIIGSNSYYDSTAYGGQVYLNSLSTLNIVGNIKGGATNSNITSTGLTIDSGAAGSTINIIGNINSGGGLAGIGVTIVPACTVNVTGNVTGALTGVVYGSIGISGYNNGINLSIIGNITGGGITNYADGHSAIQGTFNNITITGNVTGGTGTNNFGLNISTVNTLNVIGTLRATGNNGAVYKPGLVNSLANHIFSGPFISSNLGAMPMIIHNFKIIPSSNKYFELRDNTVSSNTYTLYSPDTIADTPVPANVRKGTVYALGAFTGTLVVPSPNSVSFGTPTDNTVGTAVLTANDVWNSQTSAMNTAGSIGKRLKNASTVDSTGDQLSSLL
jgi:hypothetical protein